MATVEIRMPEEQNEGTESALGAWLKQVGDAVTENDPLVEISTDKVTVEIPAPASGVLKQVLKTEGEPVAPGEVLGYIETEAVDAVEAPKVSQPIAVQSAVPVAAAAPVSLESLPPGVRRLIQEHNLDASLIPASGRSGRLTQQDVLDYIEKGGAKQAPAPAAPKPATAGSKMVPHTPMRKAIAANMSRSMQTAPHVTAVFEADLTRVLADREARKVAGDSEVPSVTAYIMAAAISAMRVVPEVNSRWHDDALEIFDDINFGFGAAMENGGLVVPVIKRAQTLSFTALAAELKQLTMKARAGKLTREDMDGGTFTISNHGVGGSLIAAPIVIAPGQASILGVGKMQKRAVVVEVGGKDEIHIRPMVYITLSIDHRVLDGQQTNAYLSELARVLEAGE